MIPAGTKVKITRGTYTGWIGNVSGAEDSGFYDPEGECYSIILKRLFDNNADTRTFYWVVRADALEIVGEPGPNLAFKMQKAERRRSS